MRIQDIQFSEKDSDADHLKKLRRLVEEIARITRGSSGSTSSSGGSGSSGASVLLVSVSGDFPNGKLLKADGNIGLTSTPDDVTITLESVPLNKVEHIPQNTLLGRYD